MKALQNVLAGWALALLCTVAQAQGAEAQSVTVDIDAPTMVKALIQFTQQSGLQLIFPTDEGTAKLPAPKLAGTFTPRVALDRLLEGSGLQYEFINDRTIAVVKSGDKIPLSDSDPAVSKSNPLSLAQVERQAAPSAARSEVPQQSPDIDSKGVPEILVTGSKILNMDIRRSRDDVQPYVIFEREQIEHSGAATVGDFLKYQLPMNATAETGAQDNRFMGDVSLINLRGLGTNQTLILIDGRRTAAATATGAPVQQDLNGIPLSAIERIEVLPTTASGIYGGGATGGVVNVILRRDYSGVEVGLTYQNTFASDVALRRADFASGLNFFDGKTNVMLTGSYTDQNDLTNGERNFVPRGRAAVLANNPAFFNSSSNILPLGSTPNIRSANGANLQLKPQFGGTLLNSSFTHVPAGYPGVAAGGGAALVANAGRYNLDLADSIQNVALVGLPGSRATLFAVPTIESLGVTVRQQFSPDVQAFFEAAGSNTVSRDLSSSYLNTVVNLPASATNNPFTTAVLVEVPDASVDEPNTFTLRSRRLAAGVIVKLPRNWQAETDYTWSRASQTYFRPGTQTAAGTAALASGSIDILRDTRVFPLNLTPPLLEAIPATVSRPFGSTSNNASLRLAGPTVRLPGGAISLSSLMEYRKDEILDGQIAFQSGTAAGATDITRKSQSVRSAYLESSVPLFGKDNAKPFLQELLLQLAVRYDEYTTDGATATVAVGSTAPVVKATNRRDSINPTLGFRFRPMEDLAFRVSYGTGFLPPDVTQLVANAQNTTTNVGTDPRRANQPVVTANQITGGNANLVPEESRSWSAGIVLTPRPLPGVRLSVDHTRIEKTDNIIAPTGQQVIDSENLFPSRIGRGQLTAQDIALGYTVGPITFLDRTLLNVARAELEALDLRVDYEIDTAALGAWQWFAAATRTLHYRTQIVPSLPEVENVGYGTATNASRFKAGGGLAWRRSQWTLGWNFSYFSDYLNYQPADSAITRGNRIANQGNGSGRVPSQSYHDVFATYRFDLAGPAEIQAGVKNVFDKEPPFDAGNSRYYSPYGDPRLATYYLSLKKQF